LTSFVIDPIPSAAEPHFITSPRKGLQLECAPCDGSEGGKGRVEPEKVEKGKISVVLADICRHVDPDWQQRFV
jgi:hypothetical protein